MSSAKITTIGFHNWMKSQNDDLFSKMNLPVGINKDTLIDNILLRAGEFEVFYSNPFVYQSAIGVWSDKHKRTFEKWVNALSIEYNPIENYDRKEEWEDNINENSNGTNTSIEKINFNSSGYTSGSTSLNGINDNKVSAYDSDVYQPESQNTNTSNSTDSLTTNTNTNNNRNNDITINKDTYNNSKHIGHVHGNIGVTTTQQMLESELSLATWNVYDHIIDLFIEEFCIAVYW